MSTRFLHRRAKIVAKLLWANRGLGTDPAPWAQYVFGQGTAPATEWPVFVNREPPDADRKIANCITVYETTPLDQARIQVTGQQERLFGFTVRVRGRSDDLAGQKAEDVFHDLTEAALDNQVAMTDPSLVYLIPCVSWAQVIPVRPPGTPQNAVAEFYNVNCQMKILPYPITG